MIDFNKAARQAPAPTPENTERRLETLRGALKVRAADLIREIFPAARIQGHEARIGDVTGAPGESMSLQMTGEKAGQWFDHATGKGGDLIDLWSMGQGYNAASGFWDAVSDLELHLGLTPGAKWSGPVARVAKARADAPQAPKPTETGRTTYVYTGYDGSAVLAQVVRIDYADGSKSYRQRNAAGEWKSPEVRPLYKLPLIMGSNTVLLVEGEKCADALNAEFGTPPATTVMGGSNTIFDKINWTPLVGKRVILWPDNDTPGRAFMAKVSAHLRTLGCAVATVEIPHGVPLKWDAADALAGGYTEGVAGLIGAAVACLADAPQAPAIDRSLRLLSISDLRNAKPPEWLIQGMVPAGCFAEVIGPPASLKSFLVLALGLSVANGRPWMGREVKQGSVIYVAGEGQAGAAPRILGWTEALGGAEDAPFFVLPQAVAMPTDQLDEFITLVAAMPVPPALIILDTLARTFGPGDENSAVDMNAFVKACDKLRALTGACVLVVHHTGKDVAKGGRGSSALLGAVDCAIAVERKGPSLVVMNRAPFGKQKDAAEFDDIRLATSERKVMMAGEQVSTLLLVADESLLAGNDDDGEAKAPKARRVGPLEVEIRNLLGKRPGAELGLTAIRATVDADPSNVRQCLGRMVIAGVVEVLGEPDALRWRLKSSV